MISTDEQLQQAYEAMGDLYQVLASYRRKILPVNPANYAIIAQGPLEEIRKIQAEIDAYLGLSEPLATTAEQTVGLREIPPPFGGRKKGH